MSDKNYNKAGPYPEPGISIDVVIFTIINKKLAVLTIKRSIEPFEGDWTLVGGYVDIHHDIDLVATAKRKLFEKTGVKAPYLAQCQTVGNATRDPRGWSVTVVYYALLPEQSVTLNVGKHASDIEWTYVEDIGSKKNLAFDHNNLLKMALMHLRQKILSSTIPVHFMPELFTLRELQDVYELILNKSIDAKTFRRRMQVAGIIEATDMKRVDCHRPAVLYRRKEDAEDYEFVRHLESAAGTVDAL